MIRIDQGNKRFNYRVVGIAIHEGYVLLHKAEIDNFWTFPGGRAEIGEPAETTLKREMKEELNTNIEIMRLLWFVENFFKYDDKNYHEIALYFLMRFPVSSRYLDKSVTYRGIEEGSPLTFQWFKNDAATLSQLPLLPSFLQTTLQILPTSMEHIVHYEK